ncbi:MAG: PadR family transcriptional regulator [Gemmatimonadota bacterium]
MATHRLEPALSYLGTFEQLVLFSVLQLEGEAYGVSIREIIEERTGRTVSIGAIYTTLGRLEERGLVRSRTEEPQGRTGRPRKYYRLSPEGARALRESYVTIQAMAGGLTSELNRLAGS